MKLITATKSPLKCNGFRGCGEPIFTKFEYVKLRRNKFLCKACRDKLKESKVGVKYELKFKVTGFPWKVFDTYDSKEDPELGKYHNLLSQSKFNNGVKVIKIVTTRTEIQLINKG